MLNLRELGFDHGPRSAPTLAGATSFTRLKVRREAIECKRFDTYRRRFVGDPSMSTSTHNNTISTLLTSSSHALKHGTSRVVSTGARGCTLARMGQLIRVNLSQKWSVTRVCDACVKARVTGGGVLRTSCTKCGDDGYVTRSYATREELDAAIVELDDLLRA